MAEQKPSCRPAESQEGFREEVGFGPGLADGQDGGAAFQGECNMSDDHGCSEHRSLFIPL